MRFAFSTLVASLALSSTTASHVPMETRQDALKPFEVTGMTYVRPSGRPGRYPWIQIRANVTDPNSYTIDFEENDTVGTVPAGIQGLNCLAEWYPGEFVEGRSFSCDPAEKGHWVMQVYSGASNEFEGSDFKLKFIHVVEPGQLLVPFRGRAEGEATFKSGANGTITYGCFSNGNCNSALKPEAVPLLAPAVRIS